MSSKQRWMVAKRETGQTSFKSPQLIIERDIFFKTKNAKIANSMNRQFLQQISRTQDLVPDSLVNPLENYQNLVGPNVKTFGWETFNMSP